MNKLLRRILFKKNRKPRARIFPLLFKSNGSVRPIFHRIVYKKSGAVRPDFEFWINRAQGGATISSDSPKSDQAATPTAQLSSDEVTLKNLKPFEQSVKDWRRDAALPKLLSDAEITAHLEACGPKPLIISVSHDNYRVVPGGVQFCLQREEDIARSRDALYLQIHPWQPLPSLAEANVSDDYPVSIICDGLAIGSASISAVIQAVETLVNNRSDAHLIVHHLMGHGPEAIARLATATGTNKPVFWLHDFFSLCPSYTLQRNTLQFCGAPDASSNACGMCVFGAARPEHQARIAAFFEATKPVVVAPSQVTATFWSSKSTLAHDSLHVVPHLTLSETPRDDHAAAKSGKLTVAYLGAPVAHKGWPTFMNMLFELGDEAVEFVVLSDTAPNLGEDSWSKVRVTAEDPDAMIRAVATNNVDFVLHWASWPETFSFTTFEAMAGGAYVLTNEVSGNVRAAVQDNGRGKVLPNQQALIDFFKDGGAARMAQLRRNSVASTTLGVQHSELSFSVPDWI